MKKKDFFDAADDYGTLRSMFELLGAEEHILLQIDCDLRVTAITAQAERLLGACVLHPVAEILNEDTMEQLRYCLREGCGAELSETIDEALYRLRVRPAERGLLLALEPAVDVYRTALTEFQRERIQQALACILLAARQIGKDTSDNQRYADVIRRGGLAIRRVLLHGDLLTAPHAAQYSNPAWNDLAVLCRNVAKKTADATKVMVHTVLPDSLYANYDERLVTQAVCNLLTNACAAPGVTTVTLRLVQNDEDAILSVADDGKGIPECALPFLFTGWSMMEKMVNTLSERAQGITWGLGLPLAQKIAEAHEGRLLWRENPQGGCVFTLSLPIGQQMPYSFAQPGLQLEDGFDIAEIELSVLPR